MGCLAEKAWAMLSCDLLPINTPSQTTTITTTAKASVDRGGSVGGNMDSLCISFGALCMCVIYEVGSSFILGSRDPSSWRKLHVLNMVSMTFFPLRTHTHTHKCAISMWNCKFAHFFVDLWRFRSSLFFGSVPADAVQYFVIQRTSAYPNMPGTSRIISHEYGIPVQHPHIKYDFLAVFVYDCD